MPQVFDSTSKPGYGPSTSGAAPGGAPLLPLPPALRHRPPGGGVDGGGGRPMAGGAAAGRAGGPAQRPGQGDGESGSGYGEGEGDHPWPASHPPPPPPLVALGGITPGSGRVGAALAGGFRGVAVLGGVWGAADPVGAYLQVAAEADGAGEA